MTQNTQDIISFILSAELQEKIFSIKIIFIVISLFMTAFILYLLRKTTWLKSLYGQDLVEITTFKAFGARVLAKKWQKITKRLDKATSIEAKLALIESDSLLDEVLKRIGYGGETLGERLKQLSPDVISNLDALWEAHKIRNNIVHDPDYILSLGKAREAIATYEQAFRDLDVY